MVKCVACTVLLVLASFQTAGAATSNVYKDDDGAFIARGYGSNRYRARQDAIRNAFNFAVEQLVVADRRIEGDRIVKDLLISSMFGKAQDLEVLEYSTAGDGEVIAMIKVRIGEADLKKDYRQFTTAFYGAAVTKIDSSDLTAALLRQEAAKTQALAQREVAYQIIESAADGYLSAIRARVANVELVGQGVHLDLEYGLEGYWIESFQDAIREAARLTEDLKLKYREPDLTTGQWYEQAGICFREKPKKPRRISVEDPNIPIFRNFWGDPELKECLFSSVYFRKGDLMEKYGSRGWKWRRDDGCQARMKALRGDGQLQAAWSGQGSLYFQSWHSDHCIRSGTSLRRTPKINPSLRYLIVFAFYADGKYAGCFRKPFKSPLTAEVKMESRKIYGLHIRRATGTGGTKIRYEIEERLIYDIWYDRSSQSLRGRGKRHSGWVRSRFERIGVPHMIVPHISDIFSTRLIVPLSGLVNSDKTDAANTFSVKPVHVSERHYSRKGELKNIDVVVYDGDVTKTYRGSKQKVSLSTPTGLSSYCEDTYREVAPAAGQIQ